MHDCTYFREPCKIKQYLITFIISRDVTRMDVALWNALYTLGGKIRWKRLEAEKGSRNKRLGNSRKFACVRRFSVSCAFTTPARTQRKRADYRLCCVRLEYPPRRPTAVNRAIFACRLVQFHVNGQFLFANDRRFVDRLDNSRGTHRGD